MLFFDIETDFDPERGFADPSDPFMPITSVSVYLQWLETMVCLAVPPKTLTMDEAMTILKSAENALSAAEGAYKVNCLFNL